MKTLNIIFNNRDYRITIKPVRKRIAIPILFNAARYGMKSEPTRFDNIIYEAAISNKNSFYKPRFVFELDVPSVLKKQIYILLLHREGWGIPATA
jgi:hypothetical protein